MMSQTKLPMTPTRCFSIVSSLTAVTSCASEISKRLSAKRRYGSDDSSGEGESTRHDTAGIHGGLERAAPNLRPERIEEQITRLSDSAGNDEDVRIEHVDQVRHSDTEKVRGVANDLEGNRIAALRCLENRLRCDPRQVAIDHRREDRNLVACENFASSLRDRRSGRIGFQASVVAAFAAPARRVDCRMPDLARHVGGTVVELAVEDQATADACANGKSDHIASAFRGPAPPFSEGRAVRVIVERRGHVDTLRDFITKWKIPPSKVRSHDHNSARAVERSGRTDANAEEVRTVRACFSARLVDYLLDEGSDPVDDGCRAFMCTRRNHPHCDLTGPVGRHRPGRNVGPAEIDADDELLPDRHPYAACERVCVNRSNTSCDESSRMQRQCPSGHRCGPCRSHGRQARASLPATVEVRASGPNPNWGTVGPNTPTVGVFIADARCCGAESLQTIAAARPISAADARMPRRPAALAPRPSGICAIIVSPIAASPLPPTTTTSHRSAILTASSG